MEPQTMATYVTEKVRAGASKKDIQEQLTSVGWTEDDASSAYAQALVALGVPVPEKGGRGLSAKKTSTVETVLNLFSFILLGIITTALGTLYFNVINYFFPDPLSALSYYSQASVNSAIHYATAALIIGFPLFVLALRMWFQKFREDENKVESGLTKWVTYLVLLASAVTVVGDLIAVLYTFLQGEISARFFLKGLTVLVIAGAIFGFYFLERRKVQYKSAIPRKTFRTFGWSLLGFIVAGIVLGFMATGTPQTERMRTFDTRRSDDLSSLASCVDDFTRQFERLPSELSELERTSSLSYCANVRDPETNDFYEYSIISPLAKDLTTGVYTGEIELCANFALPSDTAVVKGGYTVANTSKWYMHAAGHYCFMETITYKGVDEIKFNDTLIQGN